MAAAFTVLMLITCIGRAVQSDMISMHKSKAAYTAQMCEVSLIALHTAFRKAVQRAHATQQCCQHSEQI